MQNIFLSPIFEALEQDLNGPESSDIENSVGDDDNTDTSQNSEDPNLSTQPQIQDQDPNNPQDQTQNPPPNQPDDLITKFQKYLLFLKLKDLQYKISLTEYKDNTEFKELSTLLNLILEFFSIFSYDQVFTLITLVTEKFSKIKLEKIKK